MAMQWQDMTVQLEGLGQKVDPRFAKPGTLVQADNVQMDESGTLARRRGYQLAYVLQDIENVAIRGSSTPSTTFHHAVTFKDELVIFGHDEVFALASRENLITTGGSTAALVRRGRTPRMSLRVQNVTTADINFFDDSGGG